jgi:WD40 repeat protein
VIGTSGSGKSSLIRAGMLPALALGWTGDVSDWRIAVMRPGDRPLRRLAEALLEPGALSDELAGPADNPAAGASVAPLIEAELRRGPLGLVDLLEDARRIAGDASNFNLLVLVDQFEEIFRYAETGTDQGNESEAFINAILQPRLETSAAALRIYVALTMRTDALHECARFLELPEAINRAQYLTPRLKPDELRRAITEPARVFEGRVEPEVVTGLVNAVINTPDQLPILQHALARMWESASQRDPQHPLITTADITQTGGIAHALSNHADSVFKQLTPLQQIHADVLFRAITATPESSTRDTRRPQRLADVARFAGREPEQWDVFVPVLRAFAGEGVNFLHFAEPIDGSTVVDISHEALIRQWDRLRGQVALEAEQAAAYRRWRDRSDLYWRQGGELLSGADLTAALRWRDGHPQGDSPIDKYVAFERGMPLGKPMASWAARYARTSVREEADAEFNRVLEFVKLSEAKDQERVEAVKHAEQEQQATKDRATQAELATERERAEAAAREQAVAEAGARKSRKLAGIAVAVALVAAITASLATYFWRTSEANRKEAIVLRIAAEGQAIVAQARLGDTLRGALQVLAAYRAQPGIEPTIAVQGTTKQMGKLLRLIEASSPICIAVSPDGKRIVSGSSDKTLQLWDADLGIALGEPLRGHINAVQSVAFSPDGKRIVSGSSDKTLQLWDAGLGVALGEPLRGHINAVQSVAFSPDGKRIVSGSSDSTLRLWDADKGVALGEPLRGHTDGVMSVAFRPDGKRIVSGSSDNTLRLWDADRGVAQSEPLRGHTNGVLSVAFDPEGKRIVSGSLDNTLRLWDAESGAELRELSGHTNTVLSVAFSPDGTRILSGSADNTLRIWDAQKGVALGEPLSGHTNTVLSVTFNRDGKRILSGSADNTLRIWDAQQGVVLGEPLRGHLSAVLSVAFSPDSKRIVSGGADNTLRLWDAQLGIVLGEPLRGHTDKVTSVAFSTDGKRIVSGSADNTLRLWDADKGATLGESLIGHANTVFSVAFSPDGKRIVSASGDNTLRLWDADKGIALGEPLRGHDNEVTSVAFSPDGKCIVSGSADGTVRQWDANKGVALGEPLRSSSKVTSFAFSPDGKRIVSGGKDKILWVWNAYLSDTRDMFKLRDARQGVGLGGHTNAVESVAFSPDGTRIVSGSADNTLRLWDARQGDVLGEPLRGHTSWVASVAFSPDGKRIVSGSADNTLRVRPFDGDGWADVLCAILPRNMTTEEWKKWVGDLPYRRQCPNLPGPPDEALASAKR